MPFSRTGTTDYTMREKVKKTRLLLASLAAAVLVIAIALTAVSLFLTLRESYTALWYIVPISVVCYYGALVLGFLAVDRSGAIRLLAAVQGLGGTTDVQALALEMGWKQKAVEKLLKKCKRWGYID